MTFETLDNDLKAPDGAPESPDVPRARRLRPGFELFRRPDETVTEPPSARQRLKFIPIVPYKRTPRARLPVRLFFREGIHNPENDGGTNGGTPTGQADMAAASGLLKPQSAYSFDLDFSSFSSSETTNNAIAANLAGIDMFNGQTTVDVALACLQMETDSGLVCSTEPPATLMNSGSVLAVSGDISAPSFGDGIGEGQFGRNA